MGSSVPCVELSAHMAGNYLRHMYSHIGILGTEKHQPLRLHFWA